MTYELWQSTMNFELRTPNPIALWVTVRKKDGNGYAEPHAAATSTLFYPGFAGNKSEPRFTLKFAVRSARRTELYRGGIYTREDDIADIKKII